MSELLLAIAMICQSNATWDAEAAPIAQKTCAKKILVCLTRKGLGDVVSDYNIQQIVACL